jgi:hypothetical protein
MSVPEQAESAAVLWDESFLWGVLTRRSLEQAGLPYHLITATELSSGSTLDSPLLVVPGGWASQKSSALGDVGRDAIRAHVHRGGTYLGLCGGAGLGLDVPGGLSLLAADRVPRAERVPSFAGQVHLRPLDPRRSLWRDLVGNPSGPHDPTFTSHVWWPSQFRVRDPASVRVLATYAAPGDGATTSDLVVEAVEHHGPEWEALEQEYGILLDPARLCGEPAVLEGCFGAGRVLLSMAHFDTPGDRVGALFLRRIWSAAGLPIGDVERPDALPPRSACGSSQRWPVLEQLEQRANLLVDLGLRLFLWRQRNEYLLHWRRGVRGLEFCNVAVLVREITRLAGARAHLSEEIELATDVALDAMERFFEPACRLLVAESLQLQRERLTYRRCSDDGIRELREQLFSHGKSYGGSHKDLIDALDALVLRLSGVPCGNQRVS